MPHAIDAMTQSTQQRYRRNRRNERYDAIQEKPDGDGGWVNDGFFVLSPKVIDRVEGNHTIWERDSRSQRFSGYEQAGVRRKAIAVKASRP